MIDIHSHVLPLVDDGAGSWVETEALFSSMAALGYSQIVATPHWAAGMANVSSSVIDSATALAAKFGLALSLARECRIHPQLFDHVSKNPQLRVDGQDVVLVELPWEGVPSYTVSVFDRLLKNGYQPVLAHAERHPQLWDESATIRSLISRGVHIQVNLSGIGGQHGRGAQKRALGMLKRGEVSLVASDIHSAEDVGEAISRPLRLLQQAVGDEVSSILTRHNPKALLESRRLIDLADGSVEYSFDASVAGRDAGPVALLRKMMNAVKPSN